jgi:hypothetical protein
MGIIPPGKGPNGGNILIAFPGELELIRLSPEAPPINKWKRMP